MKFTHLLFDLDNTLLDFTASSKEALKEFAEIISVEYNESFLEIYHDYNHAAWAKFENGIIDSTQLRRERFELTAEYYGKKIDGLLMNRKYLQQVVQHTFFIDGAISILEHFSPTHSLSILTNGLKEVQRPRLKSAEIFDYFDAIVVSDEIGFAKPDERYFEYAWNKLENPNKEKVIMIGDSPNSDILGAMNFGFKACLIDPTNKFPEANCDYRIEKLEELKKIVF